MRHVYNEDSSPSTPEAKEDIFQCLTVYSNPKFSLANLLPSRLVLERARLSSYRHVIRFKCPPVSKTPPSLVQKSFLPSCRFLLFLSWEASSVWQSPCPPARIQAKRALHFELAKLIGESAWFFLLVAQTTRIGSYEYELPLPKITPSFFTQHRFCCCEHLYAVWMWRKASRRILCTSISTPTHLLIISCWTRVLTVSLFNFVMHVHLIHTNRARKR